MANCFLRACVLVAGIVFLAKAPTVFALDASRELTQYLHRIWQVQQGLPQATIYAVAQGREGYLWLGTQRGLYRFDGVRFSTVDLQGAEPLATAWIRDVLVAADGSLWVATDEDGLFRISTGNPILHLQRNDGLPSDRINRLMQDKAGDIWACTGGGLGVIHQNAVAHVYQMQQGLSGNAISAATQDDAGRIYVAAGGNGKLRLNVLEGGLFTQQPLQSLAAGSIQDLLWGGGKLYVATSGGLIVISGEDERLYSTADGLQGREIYRLLQTVDGTLWLGTNEGFSRLKPDVKKFESYSAADGLSQSTVYALAEDREASLWVGTKHGLNQFLDGRTVPYTTSEGLPTNDTGPILQQQDGTIWIGTFGAGLCKFDGGVFSTLTQNEGLASNSVRALAAGLDHDLWVGTDRGINHVSEGSVVETCTTADGLPSADIRCLLLDRKGNLWAGTASGLAEKKVGEKNWSVPVFGDGPGNSGAFVALLDTGDAVWASREGDGLVSITDGIARELLLEGDSLKDVDAMYRDAQGLIWLCTRGSGLGLYDGHKVQLFSVGQGLFDDDLRGIVADNQGRLWLACSKGLFSLSLADLNRLAGGMQKNIVSTPFSPTENLRTIESRANVQPAAWLMVDGRIWFSTIRGIIVLDPSHLQRNLPALPIVIEQVLIDGKDELAPAAAEAHLGPGVKNIEFRYTGLSFIAPTRVSFRYQLEGFDKSWIDAATRREAYYTNLPPGKYRFRVQGSSGDGTWSEVKTPVAFVLEPFFYQRWWFWPAVGVGAIMGLVAAYQLRLREERRRLATIVAERGRIARELHDTLIQGFSGVTMEMQALRARLPGEDEKQGLGEIIEDAGRCLREARRSIAGLRQLEQSPTGFPQMIAGVAKELTQGKPVRLQLKLGGGGRLPPLAAEVEYNLVRIVREAIANALRHADPRTVEVMLDAAAGRIELEVRDDGRGFDPTQAQKNTGHYGLIGMRERGQEIGAKVDVASAPEKGTIVRVILEAAANGSD